MNELQRSLHTKIVANVPVGAPDKRYRCLVSLVRADRPRYWNYLCSNCGSKVVELQNLEVLTVDDFYDPQNINNVGIGKHCKGVQSNGLSCFYTYFFNVR